MSIEAATDRRPAVRVRSPREGQCSAFPGYAWTSPVDSRGPVPRESGDVLAGGSTASRSASCVPATRLGIYWCGERSKRPVGTIAVLDWLDWCETGCVPENIAYEVEDRDQWMVRKAEIALSRRMTGSTAYASSRLSDRTFGRKTERKGKRQARS